MSTSFLQKASQRLGRWRRPLLWVLGVFVALELLFNGLLGSGVLEAMLNHSFERTMVQWEYSWSLRPDHLHLRNLRVRRWETNGDFWQLQMESVAVNLSIRALRHRRLGAESVRIRGLSVRLQFSARPTETAPPPERPPEEKEPWTFQLHGVRIQGVRELTWNHNKLTGITEATGQLEVVPGQRLLVRDARVLLGKGELTHQGKVVAHVQEGTADFGIDASREESGSGFDVARGLEGRLQVSTTLPSLTTFQRWVPQIAEAELMGGAGHLEADVRVKEGRLAPESRLEGSGGAIILPVGNARVRAPWRVHGEVSAREHGPASAALHLVLSPVTLEGHQEQVLETSTLMVSMETPAPRLGAPLHGVHATMHLARSKPLDLRMLNAWLGPDFQVESGKARLEGSTRAHPSENRGRAHLELRTEELRAHWGHARLGGGITVEVDAHKLALGRTTVTFDGSRLLLRGVNVSAGKSQASNWDGTLSFSDATLKLSPTVLEGHFTGSLSNTAPFITLLTAKAGLSHLLSPLLKASNLKLTGAVTLGGGRAKLERLRVHGDRFELRGSAELAAEATHAIFLMKAGPIPLGVEVTSQGTHLQMIHPYSWYRKKTGETTD